MSMTCLFYETLCLHFFQVLLNPCFANAHAFAIGQNQAEKGSVLAGIAVIKALELFNAPVFFK